MSRFRRLLLAVGVGAALLGVATAVEPGLASLIVTTRVFVPALGMLALWQGVRILRRRRRTEIRTTDTADVECVPPVDAPGVDFDRQLVAAAGFRQSTVERRDRIRTRLREIALATIQRRADCARSDAEARLEAGTWTDDPIAASFLGGRAATTIPLAVRIREALSGESRFHRDARHVADAIAAFDGGERTAGSRSSGRNGNARPGGERTAGSRSSGREEVVRPGGERTAGSRSSGRERRERPGGERP